MTKWKFVTVLCARGIAGHAKVSLRRVRGAEPSGVIFLRRDRFAMRLLRRVDQTGFDLFRLKREY
jgi:hypothetical protein